MAHTIDVSPSMFTVVALAIKPEFNHQIFMGGLTEKFKTVFMLLNPKCIL